jgi:CRP/FNR family cyclic AMP-dependent transcriptional regulator
VDRRLIVERSPMGTAAMPTSQQMLIDAGVVRRVGKGCALVSQGEEAAAVAMIGSGRLRLCRSVGADVLTIGYRGVGDLVGEAALAGGAPYRETATAIEEVEALMVPVGTLRVLAAADQAIGSCLLSVLVDRHVEMEDRLASMLFRDAYARLAEFLVKAAERWGLPDPRGTLIAAAFTHAELAGLLGYTRETVTLTLSALRRAGLITVDRRRIVVLDREGLRAVSRAEGRQA